MSDIKFVFTIIGLILALILVCFLGNQAKTEKFYSYFSQYDTFYVDGIEYKSKDVSKITIKDRCYGTDGLEICMKDGTIIRQSEDDIVFKNLED
jgi:hypothetical protein